MNILFLAYESEAKAMAVLAQRLQEDGHDVLVAQGDYYNFIDDEYIHQFFDERDFEAWVNFADEYEQLYQEDWSVDWDYLRSFEEQYCTTKNVQQLLMTDQTLARHHHFRYPYYTPIQNPDRPYYWLELLLRWSERVLDRFQPDLVVSFRRNYLIKNVFAQFSAATGLPMATIIHSRLKNKCHLVRNFGYGTSDRVQRYLETEHEDGELKDARQYIEQFRESGAGTGLYDATSQQRVRKEELYTTREVLSFIKEEYKSFFSSLFSSDKKTYRSYWKGNHFNSHQVLTTLFRTRITFNRLRYIHSNPFKGDLPDRPFVYLPLHTLPESSTLTLSTEYFERDLVRFVAKELPADFVVAVKENPNMVGLRPFSYYEELKEIPNVRLIDPTVPSKRLIRQSRGVTGISGTALLEAAVLGKPTHCFGHPEFEAVLDYHGHFEFGDFVNTCLEGGKPSPPTRVIAYLQYILDHGLDIDLQAVRTAPGSEGFEEGIEKIESLLQGEIRRVTEEGHVHA